METMREKIYWYLLCNYVSFGLISQCGTLGEYLLLVALGWWRKALWPKTWWTRNFMKACWINCTNSCLAKNASHPDWTQSLGLLRCRSWDSFCCKYLHKIFVMGISFCKGSLVLSYLSRLIHGNVLYKKKNE